MVKHQEQLFSKRMIKWFIGLNIPVEKKQQNLGCLILLGIFIFI